MNIAEFDHLSDEEKRKLLQKCCGSSRWVEKMIEALPAEDLIDLLEYAEGKWYECNEEEWREAFQHHPEIGDVHSLKQKVEATADKAAEEQSGVKHVDSKVIAQRAEGNKKYKEK